MKAVSKGFCPDPNPFSEMPERGGQRGTHHQSPNSEMLDRRAATLLLLPGEILNLVLDHLHLDDLNRLRLVCRRLKDAVELQNTLRWNKSNTTWQLPTASLTELRQHLVKKLAESFLTSLDLSKVEGVMKVWAQRLEEEAFLEAACQEEYTMALTQLILARHKKLVKPGSGHNLEKSLHSIHKNEE